jgi:GNAT superfamily N-acetyltransferase
VGVCQVLIFRHFQRTARWCAELESVYVRADQRGNGIGAAILAHAEEFARARNCYRVQLTSRNERVDAHRFYAHHGYEATSQGFKKLLGE